MKKIITLILTIAVTSALRAQTPRPADPQSEPIAITNGTIHVGNGEIIENGTVLFNEGKITSVTTGSNADLSGYRTIDASGKHVYPSLLMPSIRIGLEDISAVRPTVDFEEVGDLTPNVRTQIAFNTDSDLLPTFRFNGILVAQVAPQDGLVTGTSSIMMLDGWNWEDATLKKDDAVHVEWPAKSYGPRWWLGETDRRPNDNYEDQVNSIIDLIKDSKAYAAMDNVPKQNLKLEAMKGVISGDQSLFVQANRAEQIIEAITRLKEVGVPKVVLVGGEDVYYAKDLLIEHNIPVVLDNVHRRPAREDEDVDFPYRLPGLLADEGIKVSLRHSGMLSRGRNLPFYAGTAVAYGVDREEALKMITLNTAEILGVDDILGTIEEGKDATLVISEGDILDMRTSMITEAFIQGRNVIIEGKQQVLFERFKEKYQEE